MRGDKCPLGALFDHGIDQRRIAAAEQDEGRILRRELAIECGRWVGRFHELQAALLAAHAGPRREEIHAARFRNLAGFGKQHRHQ